MKLADGCLPHVRGSCQAETRGRGHGRRAAEKTVLLTSEGDPPGARGYAQPDSSDAVKETLDRNPPELASDITGPRHLLAGGVALQGPTCAALWEDADAQPTWPESPTTCVAVVRALARGVPRRSTAPIATSRKRRRRQAARPKVARPSRPRWVVVRERLRKELSCTTRRSGVDGADYSCASRPGPAAHDI